VRPPASSPADSLPSRSTQEQKPASPRTKALYRPGLIPCRPGAPGTESLASSQTKARYCPEQKPASPRTKPGIVPGSFPAVPELPGPKARHQPKQKPATARNKSPAAPRPTSPYHPATKIRSIRNHATLVTNTITRREENDKSF
jgi:hypothetical protein